MKITVDTEKKTITVEDKASIKEIMEFIKSAFPDSYQEYTIERTVTVEVIQVNKPVEYYPVLPSIYPTVRPWETEVIY